MSIKGRNRNIKQKINDENFQDDHLPTTWLGEYVFSGADSFERKQQNSFYRDIDTLDNLSVSKSSSSSLSWGEDCEIEATQRVKKEYDRMNTILCGFEAIPPGYDKDEYKLWMKTFPCIRLTTTIEKKNILEPLKSSLKSSKRKCDKSPIIPSKNAVIDDLLNKMCTKLTNNSGDHKVLDRRKSVNRTKHSNKIDNGIVKNTLEDDFSTILRISPAPTYNKFRNLEKRRRSTNYVDTLNYVNNNNNREYSSLPHLLHGDISHFSHGNSKNSKNLDSSKRNTRKRQYTNKVVLPPIDVTLNQFRSISAIPLHQNKCSSALSTKTNFLVGFNNPRIVNNNSSVNKGINGFY